MTILAPRRPQAREDIKSDVLIEEARRRHRRRQLWVLAALLIAAAAIGIVVSLRSGPPSRTGPPHLTSIPLTPAPTPTVNRAAFAHDGRLAFVSQNALWVLDGSTRKLQQVAVPNGDVPVDPTYSHDGRWLTYLAETPSGIGPADLCVARGDGTDARVLAALNHVPLNDVTLPTGHSLIGWSPTSDRFAFVESQPGAGAPTASASNRFANVRDDVMVWQPGQPFQIVATVDEFTGGVWSPNGDSIAVGSDTWQVFSPPSGGLGATHTSSLTAYPVNAGKPVVWRQQVLTRGAAGSDILFFIPADWWPKWGIAYAAGNFGGSAYDSSQWNGAFPISVIARPGGATKSLAEVMLNGADGPMVTSRTGAVALTTNGFAHPVWQAESVEICQRTSLRCTPVTEPRGTVSTAPEWSPDGTKLAYVVGTQSSANMGQQSYLEHWYNSLKLEVYDTVTRTTTALPAGTGSAAPVWQPAGDGFLLERDDAIWLWNETTRSPVKVAAPLFVPGFWQSFYGQIDWNSQFAWSAG